MNSRECLKLELGNENSLSCTDQCLNKYMRSIDILDAFTCQASIEYKNKEPS